jgi:hypothetical protein
VEQLLESWQAGEEQLSRFETLSRQYQEIIGMGERAVPLLLAELKREPDDWFWALHAITGASPLAHLEAIFPDLISFPAQAPPRSPQYSASSL